MTPRDVLIEFWRVWSSQGAVGVQHRYDEFFSDDFDWRPPIAARLGAEYVGREGWARYVSDFGDLFSNFEAGTPDIGELTPDLFTVKAAVRAIPAGGGSLDAVLFVIVRFTGGRMSYGWGTYDPQAAETALAAILDGEVPV